MKIGSGCTVDASNGGAFVGGIKYFNAIVVGAFVSSFIGDCIPIIIAIDDFVNGVDGDGRTYSRGSSIQASIAATPAIRHTNPIKTVLQRPSQKGDDISHGV